MFEKIKSQIKESVGENSQISEKTIDAFAKTYADMFASLGIEEEKVLDSDFFKNSMSSLLKNDIQANINSIAASAAKSAGEKAIEDYKKKNKQEPSKKEDTDEGINDLKLQLNEIKSQLQEERDRRSNEEKASQNRSGLFSKMKDLKIDGDWAKEYINQISIDKDTNVEEVAKKALNFYNKTFIGGGGTPHAAGGGNITQKALNEMYANARKKIEDKNN